MRPMPPPIVHRIEARRAKSREFDLMAWACVVLIFVLAYGILVWGGR